MDLGYKVQTGRPLDIASVIIIELSSVTKILAIPRD
jgi:hypothetical protein